MKIVNFFKNVAKEMTGSTQELRYELKQLFMAFCTVGALILSVVLVCTGMGRSIQLISDTVFSTKLDGIDSFSLGVFIFLVLFLAVCGFFVLTNAFTRLKDIWNKS
jgi:hypothetical protein